MSNTMVKRLIVKDWYFQRWTITAYLALGLIALALLVTRSEGAFFAGCVLMFTVLISLGIHVVMATVVEERTKQTLPFVMSLPVSPRDYTIAKVVANMGIFLIPWSAMLIGTIIIIKVTNAIPDGLLPFAVVLLVEILASYCLLLAVAIVSESQAWTIGGIVAGNLIFQAFLYSVSHMPSVAAHMKGPVSVWNRPVNLILLAELITIVLCLGLTFFLQDRKRDFL